MKPSSMQTMLILNRELNTTFLFATHDEKVIRYLRRKVYLLDGRIEKEERVGKAEAEVKAVESGSRQ